MSPDGLVGAGAALTTSALWAASTTVLTGAIRRFGPQAMNLFRVTIATGLFWAAAAVVMPGALVTAVSSAAGATLALSGVVGLALGDYFLFAAIRRMGAQPAVALNQLSPVWSALFGAALGTESLSGVEVGGVGLVLGGVLLVLGGKLPPAGATTDPTRITVGACALGVASSICNAAAGMLAHHAIRETGILPGATLRMTGAAAGLWLTTLAAGRLATDAAPLRGLGGMRRELLAVFGATFIGIGLQQTAFAHLPASLALSILSTTPLFLMPLAIRVLGERYRWTAWLGTLVVIAGVPLLV